VERSPKAHTYFRMESILGEITRAIRRDKIAAHELLNKSNGGRYECRNQSYSFFAYQ
jgi:hypothetical protein